MIRSKHTFRPVWRETVPRLWACEPRILNTLFEQSAHWCYQTSSEERAGRVRFCCTPAWRMKETTDRDSSSTRGDEHSNSLQAYLKKKKKSNYEQGLHSLLGGESEAWLHTHTHTHTHTRFVLSQVLGSGHTEPCLLLPRTAGCFIRA